MNCNAVLNVLDLHAERRLTASREREVVAHLKTCRACAAEASSLGGLKALAGKPSHAPASLKHALEAMLAGSASERPAPQPVRLTLLPSLPSRAVIVAAAAYAALLIVLHLAGPSVPTQAYAPGGVEVSR